MGYKTFKKLNRNLDILLELKQPLTKNIIKRIFFHPDITINKLKKLPECVQNEIRVVIITYKYKTLNTFQSDFIFDINCDQLIGSFTRECYLVQKYCVNNLVNTKSNKIFRILDYYKLDDNILQYIILKIKTYYFPDQYKFYSLASMDNLERGINNMIYTLHQNPRSFYNFHLVVRSEDLKVLIEGEFYMCKFNMRCHPQLREQCTVKGSWDNWKENNLSVIKLKLNQTYWFKFFHKELGWHIHNDYEINHSEPINNCIRNNKKL